MRRTLILIASLMSLLVGAAAAQAFGPGGGAPGSGSGFTPGGSGSAGSSQAYVTGTVGTVSAGSFTAQAYVLTPPSGGPMGGGTTPTAPTPSAATILVGSTTAVDVDGTSSTGSTTGLVSGQKFWAVYAGSSSDSLATLTASPAVSVYAFTPPVPKAFVAGQITGVSGDTFTADAFVVQPPSMGSGGMGSGGAGGAGSGFEGGGAGFGSSPFSFSSMVRSRDTPTETAVTITTDSDTTKFRVNGKSSSITGLSSGMDFEAAFDGTSSESIADLTAADNPALSVTAKTPRAQKAIYAFVGTVTATDTTDTPETVTVDVTASLPSGLVPSGSGAQTFTVGPDTLVFGGSSSSLLGGSLSDVTVGDTVAGGLMGASGQTLTQVEADPLQVLVDFPAASTTTGSTGSTSSASARTRAKALDKALKLLGKKSAKSAKSAKSKKSKKSHSKKSSKSHKAHATKRA